jgi:hypothetical protein
MYIQHHYKHIDASSFTVGVHVQVDVVPELNKKPPSIPLKRKRSTSSSSMDSLTSILQQTRQSLSHNKWDDASTDAIEQDGLSESEESVVFCPSSSDPSDEHVNITRPTLTSKDNSLDDLQSDESTSSFQNISSYPLDTSYATHLPGSTLSQQQSEQIYQAHHSRQLSNITTDIINLFSDNDVGNETDTSGE